MSNSNLKGRVGRLGPESNKGMAAHGTAQSSSRSAKCNTHPGKLKTCVAAVYFVD